MKLFFPLAILAFVASLFASCRSIIYKDVYPTLIDGRYDSEFPYRGCSQQLEEISETVKRITVIAHYKMYTFARDDSVKRSAITRAFLDTREANADFQSFSVAGTGTVITNEGGLVGVLTCAHLVDYPDTTVTFYSGPGKQATPYVRTFARKVSQLIFLNEVPGASSLEILAFERSTDLAVIGQKLPPERALAIKTFGYPLGSAKQLEWGSFVYLFGFPTGYRMVTKGIVSLSGRPTSGSFIVDAVLSPGSSGSIALAIRDGVPNFELVGIVKMIPAQQYYLLIPAKQEGVEYDPTEPYGDEVFVQRKSEIQPGIAIAIPIETIVSFLDRFHPQLSKKGYDLTNWLHPPQPPRTK